jgi:hypothetical protein
VDNPEALDSIIEDTIRTRMTFLNTNAADKTPSQPASATNRHRQGYSLFFMRTLIKRIVMDRIKSFFYQCSSLPEAATVYPHLFKNRYD